MTWDEAARTAQLFAVDSWGLGGVALRARAGPVRDRWLATLRACLPDGTPMLRVPVSIRDDRLLGGLDLAATLASGRSVAARGVLADADGGVIVAAMAERMTPATAARIAAAMDAGEIRVDRDGVTLANAARFGVVALDEGIDDERPPAALLDRLAFVVSLDALSLQDASAGGASVAAARERLHGVSVPPNLQAALVEAALALGVAPLRTTLLAVRAARAAAALAGRDLATEVDAAEAARLVLAPRATVLPPDADAPEPAAPDAPTPEDSTGQGEEDGAVDPSAERVVAAAAAAIPPDLLARLRDGTPRRSPAAGRAGPARHSGLHGRPAGVRPGRPGGGARLDVLATLQAAAPWQRLRPHPRPGLAIRPDDFRIVRRVQAPRTTTIFVIDASGSAALHRLAEAKGAVELLLGECYVRRDRVAVLAFRGRTAELLLPPSSSLTRARRSLAALPGGGATPLPAAVTAATELAVQVARRDGRAVIVLLTDGRGNVTRDGRADRAAATEEALAAGRALRSAGIASLLIDTSPRARLDARALATAMDATYLPLPQADAQALFRAARHAAS